jgi:two-component system KDP operon response regulator KdpE
VPIIVLSIRGEEASKVQALDGGADDFVVKPFGMAELLARIRSALRHRTQAAMPEDPVFRLDGLAVDLGLRTVARDGVPVVLSPREYDLLRTLIDHAGKVVTHRFLLREVWGEGHGSDVQYLRVYVGQLRAKLEPDPTRPRYLFTEPGVGYRLRAPDEPKG